MIDETRKRNYIRNLWFLLLYASDNFDYVEKNHGASKAENPDRLADLIAKILTKTVKLRLKRNLNFSYQPRQEVLRRVRGRIDILKTERRQLLQKGQIACNFEELTIDTPRNRFVRDALEKIARSVEDKDLANKCRMQALSLRRAGVKGIAPSRKEMQNQRYGRNDKNDKAMIFAARLAFDLALPDESANFNDLFSPDNKGYLYNLYEKAIANFYKKTLSPKGWEVSTQERIYWEITNKQTRMTIYTDNNAKAKKEDKKLPAMKPDIILSKKDGDNIKTIVIDTKFKDIVKKNNFGTEKLISGDIYQIYTYLISQKGKKGSPIKENAQGLLLYPLLPDMKEDEMNIFYDDIGGFKIHFVSVDFNDDEISIRKKLIKIIEEIE